MPERTASLRSTDFVEGGGLLNNVTVKWEKVRFVKWDYNGKSPVPIPALQLSLKMESGETVDQYYSCGSEKDWAPSKDGSRLIAVGTAMGINKTSNVALLLKSLEESGFPPDRIGDSCTDYEGGTYHMIRVPAPKREGLAKAPRADGRTFEDTVLVVDEIVKLPGEAEGPAKTSATNGETIEEIADRMVLEILKDAKKPMDKKTLATAVFRALPAKDKNRNEIAKLIYEDSFHDFKEWDFSDGMISISKA